MLGELTYKQFLELQEYDLISPIGDKRGDWQAASVCATAMNVALMRAGSRKRVRVKDFVLDFTSDPKEVKEEPQQTWQEMKFIARMFTAAANADAKKKRKR